MTLKEQLAYYEKAYSDFTLSSLNVWQRILNYLGILSFSQMSPDQYRQWSITCGGICRHFEIAKGAFVRSELLTVLLEVSGEAGFNYLWFDLNTRAPRAKLLKKAIKETKRRINEGQI